MQSHQGLLKENFAANREGEEPALFMEGKIRNRKTQKVCSRQLGSEKAFVSTSQGGWEKELEGSKLY